jgi:putative DNA methylase
MTEIVAPRVGAQDSHRVVPHLLKDAPALIERLLPVQKLSAESYKEQMAGSAKTLTALGSFWKGRKPLILNRACILGCLLPASDDPVRDLEIFEMLMAMDDESLAARSSRRPKPEELVSALALPRIRDYFTVVPDDALPECGPVALSSTTEAAVKITWRNDVSELTRRTLQAKLLPQAHYGNLVRGVRRAEEVPDVHDHIWAAVNAHLGTEADCVSDLVEQLGVMRYGHRPRVADTFAGSGQIPFEAARLGCDVYASDLSPVACMLTWATFHIVGAPPSDRVELDRALTSLANRVKALVDELGVEDDGHGWRAKTFLYCLEARCPQTGWMVPLLPNLVISKGYGMVADLVPDPARQRYDIVLRSDAADRQLTAAAAGTLRTDGRGQDPYLIHAVNGKEYRTKIATLRGDYRTPDGRTANRLRLWDKHDFMPRSDDIFQERLYCIQWMRPRANGRGDEYEFRSVSREDIEREHTVEAYVANHLAEWQENGWLPDMRIEPGAKTTEPIRTRGWTHWHHLWPARQLLTLGLVRESITTAAEAVLFAGMLDYSSKLGRWATSPARIDNDSGRQIGGAGNYTTNVFYNQALNTLFAYACRASSELLDVMRKPVKSFRVAGTATVTCEPASTLAVTNDIYVTDPPYGDAVKYEEILEFFIAWLRKNPPREFSDWVWDSRRSLAIKGEDEEFRRGMVDAYRRMAERMPENGIQVVMFTHQSGAIWADMANIVWAAGMHVTAAWYVVTETNNALRDGSYVKGTVLLVLRKSSSVRKTTRGDLAWEIQEEVEEQVAALTGLNQSAKDIYRDENVFEDVDIQMAGYAAALRALTRYGVIDGRNMTAEAERPRLPGESTFVDSLISFAVETANKCLVPTGIEKAQWDRLSAAERFYLKMLDMEGRGAKTLDNYQNFAKAFKVRDFKAFMARHRANDARLKSAVDFGRSEMGAGSELYQSPLRAVLYSVMELQQGSDGEEALTHLALNIPDYYADGSLRELGIALSDYLARHLHALRPEEASSARVLCELIRNHRIG